MTRPPSRAQDLAFHRGGPALRALLLLMMSSGQGKEEGSDRLGPQLAAEGSSSPLLGRRRRVQFQLPHTTFQVPPAQQEEQPFYQRLHGLLAAVQGGFVELFAAGGWEDLLEDKRLRKKLVSSGQGEGSRPQPGQEVTVKLLGVLEDQSLVEKDPNLTFVLGQGGTIQALELGVLSMQLGEVAFFLTGPACAYGHLGREPDIPKEASLLYEVTLLQVRDGPDTLHLPAAEQIGLGIRKREWGNFHFERGQYRRALHFYQLALHILSLPGSGVSLGRLCLDEEEEKALQEHRVKCLNNCAAAQLKLQLLDEALDSCNEVLSLDPNNVKALYRKGKLLSERGEDLAATQVLKRALQLEPTTKAIHAELSQLARRQRGQPEFTAPGRILQEDPAAAEATCSSQTGAPARQPS